MRVRNVSRRIAGIRPSPLLRFDLDVPAINARWRQPARATLHFVRRMTFFETFDSRRVHHEGVHAGSRGAPYPPYPAAIKDPPRRRHGTSRFLVTTGHVFATMVVTGR